MDKKLAKVQKRLRKQTDDPDTKAERKRRNKEKHLKDEERRDASVGYSLRTPSLHGDPHWPLKLPLYSHLTAITAIKPPVCLFSGMREVSPSSAQHLQ